MSAEPNQLDNNLQVVQKNPKIKPFIIILVVLILLGIILIIILKSGRDIKTNSELSSSIKSLITSKLPEISISALSNSQSSGQSNTLTTSKSSSISTTTTGNQSSISVFSQLTTSKANSTISTSSAPITMNISILDGSFSSKTINLKIGTTYKLTITNNGSRDHSLTSSILDTGKLIPGQSKTITITPSSSGTYSFKCNVPCPPYHDNMQSGYNFIISN